MSTEPVRLERRVGQRFELNLPLAVQFEGQTFGGFTQDVSSRGMFFYSEATPAVGSLVELIFTMPSEITLGESMRVRCRGHILRTSPANPSRKNGIAVRLDSYQYLPACDLDPIAEFLRPSGSSHSAETQRPVPR